MTAKLSSISLAPVMWLSSSSDDESAASAASCARFSPEPLTTDICARPLLRITFSTSAKSTRTRANSTVISSAIPFVAIPSTSSARPKASRRGRLPYSSRTRSLSMTSSESTQGCSSLRPCIALLIRPGPSILRGIVTTATVRMPKSCAIFAITGEAPVPVPPPIPAAMKSIFTPEVSSSVRSCSSLSMANLRPLAGSLPAPRPGPICILLATLQLFSAWRSVLQTTKFTPAIFSVCIWFTALPPAPPTPITIIFDSVSSCISDSCPPVTAIAMSSTAMPSMLCGVLSLIVLCSQCLLCSKLTIGINFRTLYLIV